MLIEDGCPDNPNCPDADEDGFTTCDGDCNDDPYNDGVNYNPGIDICDYSSSATTYNDHDCNGIEDGYEYPNCEERY